MLLFLPPYSPDLNPIEESFSAGDFSFSAFQANLILTKKVKAWIRCNWVRMSESDDPKMELLESCGVVTAEKAKQCFSHSGYKL
jgi:hypothetical protein